MNTTAFPSTTIPVKLLNGEIVAIEVTQTGRKDTSINVHRFEEVTKVLEGIATELGNICQKIQPNKATIKFGVEVAVESGKLTAILVKGASKANLEITMEWGN